MTPSRSTSGTDGTNDSGVTERTWRRGIVNMLKVKKARSKGILQKVNWNEMGQPIGKESMTLSHFVGSYARRNIPIICDDWRKKEWQNVKQTLWDEIKETFHGVEDVHEHTIICRAGNLHRQFRTRMRNLGKDNNDNYSADPPPAYANFSSVTPYWKQFVENSTKEDFLKKSEKNKAHAEGMDMRYKKSCVGYARIREIIIQKKIKAGEKDPVVTRLEAWEYARSDTNGVVTDPVTLEVLKEGASLSQEFPEHELTNFGTDDLLARLIPKEYSGRVRAAGWGVTKKSLQTPSTMSELSKLKNDVAYLINEIKELKSKGCNPGVQSGGSSNMDYFDMDNEADVEHDDDLPEGKNACYLYLDPGRKYVGRGILHNDLNDRILHGIPLEEGYVRVQFEVAQKSEFNTPLPRPCDEANLVGEAPGYFLAWPRKLVSMELETPLRTMNKEKGRHAKGHKKLEDKENKKLGDKENKNLVNKEKEKTRESIVGVSSRQLGYPLQGDVCDDGVLEFVRLAVVFDRVTDIEVDMGLHWDLDPWIEHINKENVLEVLNGQWLSASSLVFYIRYLCEVYLSNNPDLAAKFSFISPHIVSHLVDSSNTSLAKCLLGYVDKDHLLFVPYNVSKHWILVAINTKTESIYFMDPAPMTSATTTNYKDVKALVDTAMSMFRTHGGKHYSMTSFNCFNWIKVQCPKQNDGINCGYYVGCFIEDILCMGETKINVNFTYTPRLKTYGRDKMLGFKKNWAGYLYNWFLKGKLLMK